MRSSVSFCSRVLSFKSWRSIETSFTSALRVVIINGGERLCKIAKFHKTLRRGLKSIGRDIWMRERESWRILKKGKDFLRIGARSRIGRWKSLQHCGLVKRRDCLCILGAMAIAGMADVGRGWMPCENQTREQLRAVSPVTGTMP